MVAFEQIVDEMSDSIQKQNDVAYKTGMQTGYVYAVKQLLPSILKLKSSMDELFNRVDEMTKLGGSDVPTRTPKD